MDHPRRRLFKPLLMSVAYACHQRAGSQGSALSMDWKRVARLQHTLPILMRLWLGGEEDDKGSKDDDQSELKDPPEIIPQAGDFDSLFVEGRRSQPVSVPKPPQRRASAPSPKRARTMSNGSYIPPPPSSAGRDDARQHVQSSVRPSADSPRHDLWYTRRHGFGSTGSGDHSGAE